jgi:hypothetical protein
MRTLIIHHLESMWESSYISTGGARINIPQNNGRNRLTPPEMSAILHPHEGDNNEQANQN